MSDRAMWKMLHLLYTLRPGHHGLSNQELIDAGIDCEPDTIEPLTSSGLVARVRGRYRVTEPGKRLTQNIWGALLRAGVVVADVSALNATVFYELGLVHALGKDTITLSRSARRSLLTPEVRTTTNTT